MDMTTPPTKPAARVARNVVRVSGIILLALLPAAFCSLAVVRLIGLDPGSKSDRPQNTSDNGLIIVNKLPDPSSCKRTGICTLRDIMTWDLRAVVPVADSEVKLRKISPARFINYLHVVRKPNADRIYVAHYTTSGYGIDLSVVTHRLVGGFPKKVRHTAAMHDAKDEEQYALEIDVGDEPPGSEFLVIVEGIYWNGFRKPTEDAATYADDELVKPGPGGSTGELAILIIFPPQYPPTNLQYWQFKNDESKTEPNRAYSLPLISRDPIRPYLWWSIKTFQEGYHYQVTWDWPLNK